MQTKYRKLVVPVALLMAVTLLLQSANAQAPDAATRAAKIAPFLDDQTIAVVHVALEKVDAPALFKAVLGQIPVVIGQAEQEQIKKAEVAATTWIAGLKKAGCRELFLVVSLADVPAQPPFIVPVLDANADVAGIEKLFVDTGPGMAIDRVNGQLVVSEQKTLDRLKTQKPAPRPELAQALKLLDDGAVQIALIPSADARRVLTETAPPLPREVGDVTAADVANGVQFAALGLNLPPKLQARLVIQSKDAASAAKLQKAAVAGLDAVSKLEEVRRLLPKFAEIARLLTPKQDDSRLSITFGQDDPAVGATVNSFLLGPVTAARAAARRAQSLNNLRQLGIAMHTYHDTYGSLPPAYTSKDGKPLLSWRVHLLPYLEQDQLYKQFKLDEPWDSEHNKKLIERMPAIFANPGFDLAAGKTAYVVPTDEKLVFHGDRKTKFADIVDGTSNTIMVVEARADKAVTWTAPEDLPIDLDKPLDGLKDAREGGFLKLNADVSSKFVLSSIDLAALKAMLTTGGGEVIRDE